MANALHKAQAVAPGVGGDRLVLGVDTEVHLDDRIFGKASDEQQARRHLEALSGRTHDVYSGIALLRGGSARTGVARTAVCFRRLDSAMLDWYLGTGEWRDRAGAYAIQGRGSALVDAVDGDFWNVVGLPVALLLDLEPGLVAA